LVIPDVGGAGLSLEQRLSVETAKVECTVKGRAPASVQNASDIIAAVVAADGSVCYTSLSVKLIWVMNPRLASKKQV